jgi:hypothetical protein
MLKSFVDELLKLAQMPFGATAAGRMQASQKSLGQFQKNLQSGSPFGSPKPVASPQAKPVSPTSPSVQAPPGAASIKPGGIKPGFAQKQYNPFGKQTAKTLGIPGSNPFK